MAWIPVQATAYAPFVTLGPGVSSNGTAYTVSRVDEPVPTSIVTINTSGTLPAARFRVTFTAWAVDPATAGNGNGFIEADNQAFYLENLALDLAGWSPNPAEFDFESQLAIGVYDAGEGGANTVIAQFSIEVEEIVGPACEEFGRATRAYVSGYTRTRVHVIRLPRGEKRCLVADFNGAIAKGRTIASATWRTTNNAAAFMANARIDGRSSSIDLTAQWGSLDSIQCVVTLDNGEVYVQRFELRVSGAPWFEGETNPSSGPKSLTVTI